MRSSVSKSQRNVSVVTILIVIGWIFGILSSPGAAELKPKRTLLTIERSPLASDKVLIEHAHWEWGLGIFPCVQRRDPGIIQIQKELDFDSQSIIISRRLAGREYEPPTILNLGDYMRLKLKEEFYQGWRPDAKGQREAQKRKERSGTLRIDIPVEFPKSIGRAIGQGSALRVTGRRKVSLSGRSEWTEGQVPTATSRPSKFPALNMEQESRFKIEGTVGEKIHVQMEQDSESQVALENSIKIRYEGDEDGIIQEIEGGNTMLSLPGTRFVGYSAQHKGLFGIRMKEKIGALDLTIIASQEKASTQRKTFRGLAQETSKKIRDYQYLANTYFFLDFFYRDQFQNRRDKYGVVVFDPDQRIEEIEVYVDDNNFDNNVEDRAVQGWAVFMDSNGEAGADSVRGYFHVLDPSEYFIDRNLGYIVMNSPVRDDYVLAVAYRTAEGTRFGDIDYVPGEDETITLKLIKAKYQRPEDPSWDYEWKNVYDLGTRDITPEGFELKVYKDMPGSLPQDSQEDIPYLQIFGLDRHGRDLDSPPDGLIDLDETIINRQRGELIFPDLQPFDPVGESPLKVRVPEVYRTKDERTKREASRYYIEVKYRSRATRFSLGQFGIIEGTEVVRLNQTTLVRGRDYRIDYSNGEITFYTDEVLNPAADLVIDYEYAPFFMPQQKTLLGLRGEYKFREGSSLGMTLLYSGEKAPERRIRVGGEPGRTVIGDIDFRLRFKPQFMTSLVNFLPMVETDASSSLDITGEMAMSLPRHNVRGDAYIDDFEGTTSRTGLGVMRGRWTMASRPVGEDDTDRGKLIWYNPWDRVPVKEIWPNRQTTAQESKVHVLNLEFIPDGPSSWAGIMRALPGGSRDFSRDKFLEIWVRGDEGVLNIDLGAISEDVISNGILDTEDKLRYGQRDGILQADEDTGLDGLFDEDEPDYDPQTNPDPNGDNWRYDDKYDYSHINGTEGNASDPDRGRRPDTEDINGNGYLDLEDDYYEYSIDLSTDGLVGGEPGGVVVEDTRFNGWRLLRIPLWAEIGYPVVVGNPDPSRIEFVRLWLTGAPAKVLIQIASLEVVGNNWQELEVSPGEQFNVTVKNTHQNRDYNPPPGVKVERDPLTNIREREQSLVLMFEGLKPGHQATAYRTLVQPQDYTDYQTLKLWVFKAPVSPVEFLLRFGADEENYYQYKTPLSEGWNQVTVDLEKITWLKTGGLDSSEVAALGYSVKGNPSLTSIKRLELGVANPDTAWSYISGEIWVDELSLTNARDQTGLAGRISVDGGFADLFDMSVDYTKKGSEFRTLREKRGSGREDISRSIRGDLKLDRLLPEGWGVSIPVGLSWEERTSFPRLMPFSDVVLSDPQRYRTSTQRHTADISFRKRSTSSNPLIGLTFDRISGSLSVVRQKGVSPERPSSESYSYIGSFRYDLSPRTDRSFSLFGSEFHYLPKKLSFSTKIKNAGSSYLDQRGVWTRRHDFYMDDDLGLTWRPFNSFSLDYSLKTKRDLEVGLNLSPGDLSLGREVNRRQSATLSFRPSIFSWVRQDYSYRVTYREDNDQKLRRRAGRGRDVSNEASLSARITLDLPRIFQSTGIFTGLQRRFRPLTGSYTRSKTFRDYGLLGRPSLRYQFGLSDEAEVRTDPSASERNSRSISDRLEFNTEVDIFADMSLKAKYKYDYRSSLTSSSTIDTRRITFPSVNVRWDGIDRYYPFKELFRDSHIAFGYQRESSKRGAPGLKLEGLLSRSSTQSFSPLFSWTARWKNDLRSTLKLIRKSSSSDDFKNGAMTGTTRSSSTTVTASLTRSFSAQEGIQIPFLGQARLKSDLEISIDTKYRASYKEVGVGKQRPQPREDSREWSLGARASYQFSRRFRGGAKLEISNREDRLREITRKIREVGIWGEIRFD